MTTEERKKFDKILQDLGLNEALGPKAIDVLISFISEVSAASYLRGIKGLDVDVR